MKAQQLYIAGTEPPPDPDKHPEIDDALDAWLAAKKKRAAAAEAEKIRHESLLERLSDFGIERYPFHDETGRKKYVVAAKQTKAKTVNAPSKKQEGRDADSRRERALLERETSVETRRVPRAEALAELEPADPFAATRSAMEDLGETSAATDEAGTDGDPDPVITTGGQKRSVPKRKAKE